MNLRTWPLARGRQTRIPTSHCCARGKNSSFGRWRKILEMIWTVATLGNSIVLSASRLRLVKLCLIKAVRLFSLYPSGMCSWRRRPALLQHGLSRCVHCVRLRKHPLYQWQCAAIELHLFPTLNPKMHQSTMFLNWLPKLQSLFFQVYGINCVSIEEGRCTIFYVSITFPSNVLLGLNYD